MTLPTKVQTAITVLAQYDIAADAVAPFWYRQFLRYKPDTPPPLFGASRDYWSFRALEIGLGLGTFITLVLLAIASQVAVPHEKLLALTPPAQFVIWSVAGFAAWLMTLGMMDMQRQERMRLGLPDWREFSAEWRASIVQLASRANPDRFWLLSLWNSRTVKVAALVGAAIFLALAMYVEPSTAPRVAEVVALVCLIQTIIDLRKTQRGTPMHTAVPLYFFAKGFWFGFVGTAALWTILLADALGHPKSAETVVIALIIICLHIYERALFAQQRAINAKVASAEQSRLLAESRLHALKSQIEPHFIFNTIAHLKSMIATEPRQAEQMADDLSDFLRASLEALKHDWSTVEVEMSLAKAYLEIAKRRMGSRLSSHIRFDAAAGAIKIPPLLVQTLLENAIQHGVEPKAAPSNIHITLDIVGENILLRVVDDGVGFGMVSASAGAGGAGGTGIGLANVRERLQATYGARATFTLSANTPSGVIAELMLPIGG